VAEAAGMSTTWYTWLEQGRDVQASDAALRRLAHTLSLDLTQTRYLLELARPAHGPVARPTVATEPHLQAFLDGLLPFPAYAFDRGWNVVASNAAARRVLLLDTGPANLIERLFLDPSWRTLFADWAVVAATSVAQYRTAIGAKPEYDADVKRLTTLSPAFADIWARGAVERSPIWIKTLDHPDLGRLSMRYAALVMEGAAVLTVSIYTPADVATRSALAPTFV
jgi:hypothetical protein